MSNINIDFTSACGKFDEMINDSLLVSVEETISSEGSHSTDGEIREPFEKLNHTNTKPAILSLITPYSEKYIPKPCLNVFPKHLNHFKSHHIFSCHNMNC